MYVKEVIKLKRGKRLTREQKAIVLGNGLNPKEYMFAYTVNEDYIKVINIITGVEKILNVHKRKKKI